MKRGLVLCVCVVVELEKMKRALETLMVNSEQKVSVSTFVQTLLYKHLLCGGLVQLISVEARL